MEKVKGSLIDSSEIFHLFHKYIGNYKYKKA